jgi:hypothetical protein
MRSIESSLRTSAWVVLVASVVGPVAVLISAVVRRPGPWAGADAFLAHFHWTQAIGPLLGFPLLFGFVSFVSASRRLDARRGGRIDAGPVFLLTAIYGALVCFNYVANAFYAQQAGAADHGAVSVLAMDNPRSLCWAIEMVAYALLGVVTWWLAPIFREERALAALLRANGVVSVLGALVTLFDLGWVLTPIGLGFYAAWNALIVAIMVLVLRAFRATGGEAATMRARLVPHGS